MTLRIRTVLGDIEADQLGRTDYHEHLFQVSPLLPGDELDDEDLSRAEAQSLASAGIDAMVDATPVGLGRDPTALARISQDTQMHIVATTGLHREAHYPAGHWVHDVPAGAWEKRFVTELTDHLPVHDRHAGGGDRRVTETGHPHRAGLLKAGISYWGWSRFERQTLDAVAGAHAVTGAPIMIHLEHGSATHEVLDVLETSGVPARKVVLAHIDRNPDPYLLTNLAQRGAYLGMDGMARHRAWPDSALVDLIARLAENGATHRVLLGGDVARRTRYIAYGGIPGLRYLPERFIPQLVQATSPELVSELLVDNPARVLAWVPDPSRE